jgi:hypothetical protein
MKLRNFFKYFERKIRWNNPPLSPRKQKITYYLNDGDVLTLSKQREILNYFWKIGHPLKYYWKKLKSNLEKRKEKEYEKISRKVTFEYEYDDKNSV